MKLNWNSFNFLRFDVKLNSTGKKLNNRHFQIQFRSAQRIKNKLNPFGSKSIKCFNGISLFRNPFSNCEEKSERIKIFSSRKLLAHKVIKYIEIIRTVWPLERRAGRVGVLWSICRFVSIHVRGVIIHLQLNSGMNGKQFYDFIDFDGS